MQIKFIFIIGGILTSALAQICMKKATDFNERLALWLMLLAASAVCYFISFVAYYYALKNFPISKVSPIMTVGVVILVVLFGAVSGEKVTMIHAAGVTIGIVSIFFLMQ